MLVHSFPAALPGDVDLMVKMKATIDTQRDEIRELNQENERHQSEIEAVSFFTCCQDKSKIIHNICSYTFHPNK